jgi:alkaline phosphatase
MPGTQPLFAQRPSSAHSDERADEEDALLGNQRNKDYASKRLGFWKEIGLFVWALVATAAVIVLAVVIQHQSEGRDEGSKPKKPSGKRNLIFMVSDGMGPASLSLTRSFRQLRDSLPIDDILTLDRHFIGSSRTRSSSSLVTDSAAGATAFSCGMKSYNGAISVLPDHTPCGTVLEAAKRAGYMTGLGRYCKRPYKETLGNNSLVVTTDITDATPACFASHVKIRTEEDLIAQQEIGQHPLGRVVDLMLGGGRCHFLPNTNAGSCRADSLDVTKIARENYNWTYIDSRKQFDDIRNGSAITLPLLGLFADTDFPFELDRRTMNDLYPSLEEMAKTAIKALEAATADSEQGFFLLIEGSRIDHAGHANDPAAQVHEVLAYDKAFAAAADFIERSNDDGVLIATSDHETGGLSVAKRKSSAISAC